MKLSTGSETLNTFLKGYPLNKFTLIYGEPATGKTTLALIATQGQIKHNKKVIYIDTENGFSLERLKQLNPELKDFNNIITLKPKNFKEQEKLILNLPKKNVSLIIIDTIGNYYRKEKKPEANESLIKQLTKLKEINNNNIPILLINQVYTNLEGETIPVSNNIITNFSKNIIKLEKEPRIIKHKKNKLQFQITDKGIISNQPESNTF